MIECPICNKKFQSLGYARHRAMHHEQIIKERKIAMTEQMFKFEMRRAETMRKYTEPERSEYWTGYIRGLRRAYHGEKFGNAAEHNFWMDAKNSLDESRKQRGQGYCDGLEFNLK